MNRDQTINKFIQKTIEIASGKIEKTIKQKTLFSSPGAKPARGLLGHLSLGPRPDSQRPGRRIGPPRRPLPRPHGPPASPGGEALSRPPILIGWSPARFAGSKPTTTRRPSNPSSFFPSPFSLLETEATAAGHGGPAEWAGRRHCGLLAGARARRWVSAPPSSSPWMAPGSRAPHAQNPSVPERQAGGFSVPRCPASGGANASRAPVAAVARGPGRPRALSSLGLGLGFAMSF